MPTLKTVEKGLVRGIFLHFTDILSSLVPDIPSFGATRASPEKEYEKRPLIQRHTNMTRSLRKIHSRILPNNILVSPVSYIPL